jgi:hypothetical protein
VSVTSETGHRGADAGHVAVASEVSTHIAADGGVVREETSVV